MDSEESRQENKPISINKLQREGERERETDSLSHKSGTYRLKETYQSNAVHGFSLDPDLNKPNIKLHLQSNFNKNITEN